MYADYSQVQDFLTFLIEFISIIGFGGCVAHSILKQHLKLSKIIREVATPSQPEVTQPIAKSELTEFERSEEKEEMPETTVMLQIPVVEVPVIEVPVVEVPAEANELDIDNIPLRTARKLASSLKIKQKVNGKDQPLSWLRAQIKKKLISAPNLMSKAIEIVKAA